jgi:hypothetical protein
MTKQEAGVLACRLLAMCGFFMFLLRIEELFGFSWGMFGSGHPYPPEARGLLIAFMISPLLILLFSLLVWFKAEKLTRKMLPYSEDSAEASAVTAKDLQVAAFSVVGLVAIVYALPQLCGVIVDIFYTPDISHLRIGSIIAETWFKRSAVFLTEFLLGIALLFGSRGFVGFLYTIRHAGLKE